MKRGEHHGALREALLAAGLTLLDRDGIEGVTIRACARAAGVSHAAPGNHFPDRRALLSALAVRCMEQLDAQTRAELDQCRSDPRHQLEIVFESSVRYGRSWPNRYRLMGRADLRDSSDPALQAALARLMIPITAPAEALAPQGAERDTLVLALCAMLSGYVFMVIDGNAQSEDAAPTGRARHLQLLDMVLAGS